MTQADDEIEYALEKSMRKVDEIAGITFALKETMMEWTSEQLEFYAVIEEGKRNIILQAVAGSGKTTSLVEGANRIPEKESTIALAFNVKIKKELEKRLLNSSCLTLNGLGHRGLGKYIGRGLTVERGKTYQIIKELFSQDKTLHNSLFSPVLALVGKAKAHGIVPKGQLGKGLLPDEPESWQEVIDHYGIDTNGNTSEIIGISREVLKIGIEQALNGLIDFDDQIYITACWPVGLDRYNNVMIDEAQDLSAIQHVLLKKSLHVNGRVIAVGDPHQAIYGFRAAMHNSIDELVAEFDMQRMGLTVSFRCAKNIVRRAQEIYPVIQYWEGSPEGIVDTLEEFNSNTFETGDVILCRNNGPTIGLAFKLIREGRGVHVIGRDIGAGLKNLVKKLANGETDLKLLWDQIELWGENESIKAANKNDFAKVDAIMDKAESLKAVIDHSGATTIEELKFKIDELFGRQSAPITMSTVHRAKGMEWDRVFFLDPHLIPSKWAKKHDWMMIQEKNLLYVATTRAKNQLTYITTEGWEYE